MSGDRVVLVDDANGNAARLVRTTARLAGVDLGPHALVGGLAVMCRLAAVHRVTQDVDTVTETTTPPAVEVVASSIGRPDPSNPSRVIVDGVTVDIIDTEALRNEDLEGLDVAERLFLVSHRWALDTAAHIEIVVGDVTATIRVSTPSALVGMKAGALLGGPQREQRKRASDLYDAYRLTVEYDRAGAIADELSAAPFGLGCLVGEALRSRVIDEPERAARWLLDGGAEMSAITPDDLRDAIGPLVDRLSR